jgi:peptide/nickel transport system substrate-binding protein
MRRFNLGVITICICLVALANVQCGRDGGESDTNGSTLTILVPGQNEYVLGPAGWDYFLVFLGLARGEEDSDNPEPRMLDRWEHTPDYKEWTVQVRDSLWWEDGVPVTAEDVKFSLELWTDPDVLYENRFFETITVLDSHTLRVTFKEPVTAKIFVYNWLPMLPKHLLDTLDPGQIHSWPFWIEPVGAGPFRYVRHVPTIMTELEANPNYYREQPKIPRIVLRYGGNALTELRSGNVDIVVGLTPLQAVGLAADPRFRIYHNVDYKSQVAIAWNHRNPLFRDVEVRRALTMSIDRRELHRVLDYPDDLPISDVPVLARHYAQGVVPDPLPFDPEGAARLFAGAGWVDTDNNNILEKNGREFRFTLSTTPTELAEAIYLQDQFHRAGVRMEISTSDRSVKRQRVQEHDFDAAIVSTPWVPPPPPGGWLGNTGYENAELDRLLDARWSTLDGKEADKHLRGIWEIMGAEIPITYLHKGVSFFAAHRRVMGIQNNRGMRVEALWIEDGGGEPDE